MKYRRELEVLTGSGKGAPAPGQVTTAGLVVCALAATLPSMPINATVYWALPVIGVTRAP
jgi:hypothetical protein